MAENRIGCLWNSKYGGFTGKLELDGKKIDIIVFENKNKKSEKSPDFDILIRKVKEQVEKVETSFGGVPQDDCPW